MRIISGKFKGIKLLLPINKKTRPLKDMVKESIFNFLIHSNKISFQLQNSLVLDLYSGTGSFGLECLSHEAKKIIFIEKDEDAIKSLEKNILKLKEEKKVKIFCSDVFNLIEKKSHYIVSSLAGSKPDLIFCDPPFKDYNIIELSNLILLKKLLKENGVIVFHRHKNTKENLSDCFKIIDERVYGDSKIIFAQAHSN
jgi:16S rRNA (guanine966-N2)-methyltransferase